MQSLELFACLLLSSAFEAAPAAVGVARDDFKSVFGECVNNFLLAYVDYAGGDEHGVVCHEIGYRLAEHDYDIGNNVCNDYVEFAADLVGKVAVNKSQTVAAEAVHLSVFLRSFNRELVYVNARCALRAEQERGYLLTKTPLMAKRELYKISGHWDHYLDGMFVMGDPADETKECFALRPMTCPFQYQVFLNRGRSYRDLPMRLGETSTLFRNEDSGEMHGLIRVRQFTISEGHLVLRPDQLEEEFKQCLDLAKYCLGTVGLLEKCTFRFSQWDPANPNNKYEGTAEQWDHAQAAMERILKDLNVDYTVGIDEAAFYGPKLDIQYKNVYGKEDTLVTIQIDMLLAERFGMYYIDENGDKQRPYIIHRTSVGCYERTLAWLIEKYAGMFPTWLCPEQVRVIPISDKYNDYAAKVEAQLKEANIRCSVDGRSEKMGYKIREARLNRVPYLLIVGAKEEEEQKVSVRSRYLGDEGSKDLGEFIEAIKDEIAKKTIRKIEVEE